MSWADDNESEINEAFAEEANKMSEQIKPRDWPLDAFPDKTSTWECVLQSFDAQALEIEKLKAENNNMREKLEVFRHREYDARNIEEVQAEFRMKQDDWIEACQHVDRLQSRVEKLKGALKFYAQNEHWQSVSVNGLAFNATFELGEKAREALIEDAKLESESGNAMAKD